MQCTGPLVRRQLRVERGEARAELRHADRPVADAPQRAIRGECPDRTSTNLDERLRAPRIAGVAPHGLPVTTGRSPRPRAGPTVRLRVDWGDRNGQPAHGLDCGSSISRRWAISGDRESSGRWRWRVTHPTGAPGDASATSSLRHEARANGPGFVVCCGALASYAATPSRAGSLEQNGGRWLCRMGPGGRRGRRPGSGLGSAAAHRGAGGHEKAATRLDRGPGTGHRPRAAQLSARGTSDPILRTVGPSRTTHHPFDVVHDRLILASGAGHCQSLAGLRFRERGRSGRLPGPFVAAPPARLSPARSMRARSRRSPVRRGGPRGPSGRSRMDRRAPSGPAGAGTTATVPSRPQARRLPP